MGPQVIRKAVCFCLLLTLTIPPTRWQNWGARRPSRKHVSVSPSCKSLSWHQGVPGTLVTDHHHYHYLTTWKGRPAFRTETLLAFQLPRDCHVWNNPTSRTFSLFMEKGAKEGKWRHCGHMATFSTGWKAKNAEADDIKILFPLK